MSDKATILQNAQRYMAKGQIDKAIDEWQKLISESPNDGNIYNTIGDLFLKKNNPAQATEAYLKGAEIFHKAGFSLKTIAVYKKLIKLVPHRIDILIKLGDLNAERGLISNAIQDYLTAAKQYSQDERIKEALEVYRKITHLDQTNTNARLKLAEMCLKEGFKKEAMDEFLKLIEFHQQNNQFEEAESLRQRVLKLDPQSEAISHTQGPSLRERRLTQIDGLIEKNIYEAAQTLLSQFIEEDPDDPIGHQRLGGVLLKIGDIEQAFGSFKTAVRRYMGRSEYGQASKLMKDYLEADPDRTEAHSMLAEVYEQGGNPHLAVSAYARVIDEYLILGETLSAEELYTKIKALEPQHRDVRRLRHNFETAEPSQTQARHPSESTLTQAADASLSPSGAVPSVVDPVALQNLLMESEVYLKYGLLKKAVDQLQQVLALDPNNVIAHEQLKDIYKSGGQNDKAIDECLRLVAIYERMGDAERHAAVLEEVKHLDPDNSLVKEAVKRKPLESKAKISEEEREREDLAEQMAEADFYYEQGLRDEAKKIYEQMLALEPHHEAVSEKLKTIATEEELEKAMKAGGAKQKAKQLSKPPTAIHAKAIKSEEQILDEELEKFFAPFMTTEIFPAADVPSEHTPIRSQLDSIFSEFQKVADERRGDIDYETHYNLGIAYKEMGLLNEAILEFKQALKGPDRTMDASSMLAVCYQESGNLQEAVEQLEQVLSDPRGDAKKVPWLRYDLACLYEKQDRLEKALALLTSIFQSHRHFKDVAERIQNLQGLLGKRTGRAPATGADTDEDAEVDTLMDRVFGKTSSTTKTKEGKSGAKNHGP